MNQISINENSIKPTTITINQSKQ